MGIELPLQGSFQVGEQGDTGELSCELAAEDLGLIGLEYALFVNGFDRRFVRRRSDRLGMEWKLPMTPTNSRKAENQRSFPKTFNGACKAGTNAQPQPCLTGGSYWTKGRNRYTQAG